MLQPENQPKKYQHLFTEIDTGKIKIPKFQRDFIWEKEQTAKLIDSIIKGYPIGTFILWKTREELRHYKDIGNIKLPETPKGDSIFYVLDGQQRITSLYAVKKGIILTRDNKEIDYKDISIDLSFDSETDDEIVLTKPPNNSRYISVYKLLNGSLTKLMKDFDEKELEKIEKYQKRLTGYDFPTIVISDYPMDIACDIFTRINTGGTELTLFEIMVAKTYDEEKNFDLLYEYEWLIDNKGVEKDLQDAGFETTPSSTVLQCISAYLSKSIRRNDILKLNKYDVIKGWKTVKQGIFHAVDYMRSQLRIPVSNLLPYYILLFPFTYFFIKNNGKEPTKIQNKLLIQYFWWASLTSRFSSSVDSKMATDLNRIDDILQEKTPSYRGEDEVDLENKEWQWFSTGDAFCKAILCIYAYFEPKSFSSSSIIKIDNSWLIRSNSKNYHHFFPRSYLRKKGFEDWKANSIFNITFVDEYLNKRTIGAKPPSRYMRQFSKENSEIKETMKTHLIDDLDRFGIWIDDYEKFIKNRYKRVVREINKRLEPKI